MTLDVPLVVTLSLRRHISAKDIENFRQEVVADSGKVMFVPCGTYSARRISVSAALKLSVSFEQRRSNVGFFFASADEKRRDKVLNKTAGFILIKISSCTVSGREGEGLHPVENTCAPQIMSGRCRYYRARGTYVKEANHVRAEIKSRLPANEFNHGRRIRKSEGSTIPYW